MKGIKFYLKKKQVPLDVKRRILKYVEYMQERQQDKSFSDINILDKLS